MRSTCAAFASVLAIALSSSAFAATFTLEGVYNITSRDECAADRIDSIVLYSDQDGTTRATLSSAEYTIDYQSHLLTWDGAHALTGYTVDSSRNAATFSATLSADDMTMTGTVDALACDGPWNFTAERVERPAVRGGMTALESTPTIETLAGTYDVSTNRTDGTLRMTQMPDGRILANFGTIDVPRILSFSAARLDTDAGILELFAFDGDEPHVKWVLHYGNVNGRLALQGYGLSRWGGYFPIDAMVR